MHSGLRGLSEYRSSDGEDMNDIDQHRISSSGDSNNGPGRDGERPIAPPSRHSDGRDDVRRKRKRGGRRDKNSVKRKDPRASTSSDSTQSSPWVEEESITIDRICEDLGDTQSGGTDFADLSHYDGLSVLFVQEKDGGDVGYSDGEEFYASDEHSEPIYARKRLRRAHPPRVTSDAEEIQSDASAPAATPGRRHQDDPVIPRAEMVDYLEERDHRNEAFFDRIVMRLGAIEDRLLANTPPQDLREDSDVEVRERPRKKGRKSDGVLKQFIRKHTCLMLGIESLKQNPVPDPPTEREIARYSNSKNGGPRKRLGRWRPDLVGPKRSPWNLRAAQIFRRSFLKSGLYGEWSPEDIERALFVHMNTLRARYKDQKGERPVGEYRLQKIKAAWRSRLQTLIKQRKFACSYDEDLAECAPLIDLLAEKGGMSGDESDNNHDGSYNGSTKYFRIRPVWRAPAVSKWLDPIDKVYVASRFQDDDRATAGNWIRKRYNTNRVDEKATPIPGLPKNFYDDDWLKNQPPRRVKRLKMKGEFSLEHTDHIKRVARRFSNVQKRSDRPIGRKDR